MSPQCVQVVVQPQVKANRIKLLPVFMPFLEACKEEGREAACLSQLAGSLQAGEWTQQHDHGGHQRAGPLKYNVLDLRHAPCLISYH